MLDKVFMALIFAQKEGAFSRTDAGQEPGWLTEREGYPLHMGLWN